MPTIVLITGHFSNSAELLKFRGKGQIPRLGSKFRGPRSGPYTSLWHSRISNSIYQITILLFK